MVSNEISNSVNVLFDNPFQIEDIQVFDDETLHHLLTHASFGLTCCQLGYALQGGAGPLTKRIKRILPNEQRERFQEALHQKIAPEERDHAREEILQGLFWELIYWKKPELYEELTAGEYLHPQIFQHLASDLQGKKILDAGAGSGRASLECLRARAQSIVAVDPSIGLLRILKRKLAFMKEKPHLVLRPGRFEELPLENQSVDIALSCSAFTATDEQGGEPGLAELERVTRPEGKIVIIWPRVQDHDWFRAHGFHYVSFPVQEEMCIHFRSPASAQRCARLFYAHNPAILDYLVDNQTAELPFSVLGINPPRDYFWRNGDERN
ncbi:class I SAM-dependent methyltransferase [Tengunoibacter tsumagoiensis]|uniref:Methyltransferase domain-containing protein n=1 Tax=Tengunoibacter tsumagoiensis TaxID=2014871 RepID=A0A402A481_9CHLR|nr:class I SAM-dependent methyltransferase [Tengunoibacter tsumagoiensis]GCE13964.1 hypothetical protein KTT_38230 [Tengunoibacter tsumagoiensis]